MTAKFVPRMLAAMLAVFISVIGIAEPAQADQKKVQLGSSAAGPFADNLTGPLFNGTYVPGSVARTFYVKNNSAQTARVTLTLIGKTPANAFEDSLSFTAKAGGFASQTPIPLFTDPKKKKECRTIVVGPTMQGQAVQPIEVTMHIDDDLDETAMNQTASFQFVVTLSQVTNKGKVDACGEQPPGAVSQSIQVMGAQTAKAAASPSDGQRLSASPRSSGLIAGLTASLLGAGALLFLALRRRRTPSRV